MTVHTSLPNLSIRNRILLLGALLGTDRLVFCSRASFESFPRGFRALIAGKSQVIRNGVNVRRVHQAKYRASSESGETNLIVSVGRLRPSKNPGAVLRAFAEIAQPDRRLVFCGTGALLGALVRLAHELEVEDLVSFPGELPREAVYSTLWKADVFVSLSRVEGMPIAVLEALSAECPAVLSDIPPHRELARVVDGLPLVDPDDVSGAAEAMERFLQESAASLSRMGRRCRHLVEENFSLDAMLDEYDETYRHLVSPTGSQNRRPVG